jgi:signal peptidase II
MSFSTVKKVQVSIIATAALVVALLDQVTKSLIIATIPYGSVPVKHETFFWLTHERNMGLVGGAFRNVPWVPYLAPLAATAVLIYLFRHLNAHSRVQALAYGLVAGGAVGNLVDRLRLGWVTDFLQVHFYFVPFDFPWKMWPAFNVADAAICVGVAILVVGWGRNEAYRQDEGAAGEVVEDRPR